MHETALISSVISTLDKQVKKRFPGTSKVGKVRLKLGRGPHNLEPERVREVFALLARGTAAEGAEVEIAPNPNEHDHEIIIESFEVVSGGE